MKTEDDVLIKVEDNDIPADGHFIIPNTIKAIGPRAFASCNNLIAVTIPSGVTTIGEAAFFKCMNLTTITIPKNVTRIENDTFYACAKLHSVSLPTSLISIGERAFYDCNKISSFIIPSGVTTIGQGAFQGCANLTTITIPQGVTRIEKNTFFGCDELDSVSLPTSLISIGEYAFYGCKNISSFIIPSGVTTIGEFVFLGCAELTTITIPQGVTRIEKNTFFACTELHSVSLPTSLVSIGFNAFYGCSMLTTITLPQGVTVSANSFSECSKLSIIVINADTLEAHLLIKNQLPSELKDRVFSKNEYAMLQQIKQRCLLDYYKALGKQPHLGTVGHRFNSMFGHSFFALLPPELLSTLNSYPDCPYQEALPQLDKLYTKIARDTQGAINWDEYQKQCRVLLAAYFNNRFLPTNPKQTQPASNDVSIEVTKALPDDARTNRR